MRLRAALVALAAAAGAICLAPGAAALESGVEGDKYRLSKSFREYLEYRKFDHASDPARRLVDYAHAPLCNVGSPYLEPGIDGECLPPDGTVAVPGCGNDEPLEPLWRRSRPTVASSWGKWRMVIGWICPDDLLPPFPEEAFRELTIEPLVAHRQPSSDEALANKPLIVYADAADRTFRTSLFTFDVDVVATPRDYTWDFGDGETLTTTSAGSPYPSFELTHSYSHTGRATVTLTTTWTGRYRVDEDPDHEWRKIEGTAFTTTTLAPFDVIELRSRLDG